MFDRKEFKLIAKNKIKTNKLILKYWLVTLFAMFLLNTAKAIPGGINLSTALVMSKSAIFMGATATLLYFIIWLLTYPIWIGRQKWLIGLHNAKYGARMTEDLYSIYKEDYFNVVFAVFTTRVIITLWSMLFIVPGIIASYRYRYVEYILAERPALTGKQARLISKEMTDGHKKDLFVMDLSFILWNILATITAGLVNIYVAPYKTFTNITAYKALKKERAMRRSMPAPVAQDEEYYTDISEEIIEEN